MAYLTLFLLSLTAATILPLSSEAALLYYVNQEYTLWLLFVSATLGNVLGSLINYSIGKRGIEYLISHQKITIDRLEKSEQYFKSYGSYALLLSWVPIIGDPITFVAGVLHYDIRKFIAMVTLAKSARYALLLYITLL